MVFFIEFKVFIIFAYYLLQEKLRSFLGEYFKIKHLCIYYVC